MYSSSLCLASLLNWNGCLRLRSDPFTPWKWHSTHCVGSWVGPKTGLGGCWKSHLHRDSIPCRSLVGHPGLKYFLNHGGGGNVFSRNVSIHLQNYTVSKPTIPQPEKNTCREDFKTYKRTKLFCVWLSIKSRRHKMDKFLMLSLRLLTLGNERLVKVKSLCRPWQCIGGRNIRIAFETGCPTSLYRRSRKEKKILS